MNPQSTINSQRLSWLNDDHLAPIDEDEAASETVTLWQAKFRPVESYRNAPEVDLDFLIEIQERLLDGGDLAIVGGLDGVAVMPTINFLKLATMHLERGPRE